MKSLFIIVFVLAYLFAGAYVADNYITLPLSGFWFGAILTLIVIGALIGLVKTDNEN